MSNEINSSIKNVSVLSGNLSDEELYLIRNPEEPWAGMTLDFQALDTEADVQIGTGGLTESGTTWDGEWLEVPDGASASFDIANHDNADGLYVFDLMIDAYPVANKNYLGAFIAYSSATPGNVQSFDGTNVSTSTGGLPSSTDVQCSIVYHAGDALFSISSDVEGSTSDDVVYDGAFNAMSQLDVLENLGVSATMKNLRRYSITSYIQGKAFCYRRFPPL